MGAFDGYRIPHYGILQRGDTKPAQAEGTRTMTPKSDTKTPDLWRLPSGDHDLPTVAHIAARFGALPEGFAQWALADSDGYTVAHIAASMGTLPEGFDQWDMTDHQGNTVRDCTLTTKEPTP